MDHLPAFAGKSCWREFRNATARVDPDMYKINNINVGYVCVLSVIALVLPSAASASEWVRGMDKAGCSAVCAARNSSPVSSGTHPNGGVYDVCLGETYGDGWRPGYNLSNWNPNACAIAFNGIEDLEGDDSGWCLCDAEQTAEWIEGSYASCSDVCARGGKQPFHPGYHRDGEVYSVCAVDVGGDGWRVGYQLNSFKENVCNVAYAGNEVDG